MSDRKTKDNKKKMCSQTIQMTSFRKDISQTKGYPYSVSYLLTFSGFTVWNVWIISFAFVK